MKSSLKIGALWSIGDQGLQSVTNLLTGLFLIRFASKEEYGLYGVAFALILFTLGIANALVMTQMTVFAHSKPEKLRPAYCGSMLLMLLGVIGMIIMIVMGLISLVGESLPVAYTELATVFCLSFPGIVLIEFVRRYLYLVFAPKQIFVMGLAFSTIYLGLLALFYVNDFEQLHLLALGTNGIVALTISLLLVTLYLRLPLRQSTSLLFGSIRESWRQGAWALGGVTVTALQSQGHVYLLASLQGAGAVAEANAARLILAPIGLIITSLGRVFMPRMAHLRSQGQDRQVMDLALKILVLVLICVVAYVALVSVSIDWILSFFSEAYKSLAWLVFLWAIAIACEALRFMPTQLLQVYRQFRMITTRNTITAIITLSLIAVAATYGSISGVIVALAAGELILALLLWRGFQRVRDNID